MEELGAETVKTEWKGPALQVSSSEVSEIINSTASTGGDAGATVRETDKSERKRISLTANLGSFSVTLESENVPAAGRTILAMLRDAYTKIRTGE
jgi:hypothetical protein